MMLLLTRQSKQVLSLEVMDDEGQPQFQVLVNRFKPKDIDWVAELLDCPRQDALALVNQSCESTSEPEAIDFTPKPGLIESVLATGKPNNPQPDPLDPPAGNSGTPVEAPPFVFHVREIDQLKQHGRSVSAVNVEQAFREALAVPLTNANAKEPLIEWHDTDTFCCLDIDYHNVPHDQKPTYSQLSQVLSRVRPQPLAFHMSHGNGAKLYYISSPGYTATELAAIAGVSWLSIDGRATFDLIKSTRHPCYGRSRDAVQSPHKSIEEVAFLYGQSDVSAIRKVLLSDVEYGDVEDFLTERGWSFGQSLPHSECPIQPTSDSKESVFVGEKGIYCHRCQAKGYGGATAGFMSYSQIVGTVDNRVTAMVKNCCHLEHAKVILANVFPHVPHKVLTDVYRVMLKIVHGHEDPRIILAMNAGKGFLRVRGQWVTADGSESLANGLDRFVSSLPATKYVVRSGEKAGTLAPDVAKSIAFSNAGDLAEHGYPDISFLRGCKIYGQFLNYRNQENIKVVIRPEFKNHVPQYIPITKRMPSEDAWGLLDSEFKGIDRNYVKLLIASKGASEGRLAQCPYLLVAGVSGAGKSTTVHIAAGICGDKADEPIFTPFVERFRAGLMDAARNSGFVCVNEIFKSARDAKMSAVQALNPMLSLTEDSRSHVLYVGSVPFGRLPVFVLTDIDVPPEVEADRQLERRFIFYYLPQSNNWQDNLVSKGFRPHEFRLLSYDHNAAADSILSEVIDEFFLEPVPLYEIAKKLQSGTLGSFSGEQDRTHEQMSKFYAEVCKAPALSGYHANRYSGEGWKVIDRSIQSPLNELWDELCDGREPENWLRSRTLSSSDWKKLLGLDLNVMCEIKAYKGGNYVYIRFRSTESSKKPGWVNGKKTKPGA
jgi:hypothetical protein